jgi:hypothetical protein
MNVRSSIQRAAPVLAQHGSIDQEFLLAWLLRAGLSRADALNAIRFVPLAFAREILSGSGVTLDDTYIRVRPDGTKEEHPLSGEPFFREAATMAPQIHAELGSDAFTAIVCLSSEFDAVNQALNAGASPEYLVASPPLIEWPDSQPDQQQRPWWKFWG